MIDHVGLNVSDLAGTSRFYERTLVALGYEKLMAFDTAAGFGKDGKPFFWLMAREPTGGSTHVAFACDERKSVDFFHAAAVAAGGTDNGAPGPREHLAPNYYAAFVLDPEGNNVEAVCHNPA
jgi:catechol 2,3-dioxygenase-like lactoylglutathione lyase family enzyme